MNILTFGGLSIHLPDQPGEVVIPQKVEALVAYLACTKRMHSREVLAELLWAERSQDQSLANLRTALTTIRRQLGPYVLISRDEVGINPESGFSLDVDALEQRLALADAYPASDHLSTEALQALEAAAGLYRGDFLEGFYVDSRAFEDWALLERERLRFRVTEALDRLVAEHLARGAYTAGIAHTTRLLGMDPLREKTHRQVMQLLAESGQRTAALVQYENCRRLLREELDIEPSAETVTLQERILAGTLSAAPRPLENMHRSPATYTNPYKGMRAFQEVDAPDFFGREALVKRLVARLSGDEPQARFLAVVGPSGCGKSSVVRAGLLPALRAGALPGSDCWQFATMMPGAHPLDELAVALRRALPLDEVDVLTELGRDARGLLRLVRQSLPEDPRIELVLVIDQAEEIFSLVRDEAARRQWLDNLLTAQTDPHSRIRIVISLRADFFDQPLFDPTLAVWVRQCTEVVLPLSAEELERAITGPAERTGVTVEPALVSAIVADVTAQPGALPLLQYTLTELFEHRKEERLALAAYRAGGGVRGAVTARADALYAALSPVEQAVAQQVFLRLVQLGEGTEDTRRRVPWTETVAIAGSEERAHAVVDRFVRHRLLTLDQNPATGTRTVELAHEALIREWGRLRGWIEEGRADLRQQRLLSASAAEWRAAGEERSYLLSGSRLAQFEDWAAASRIALTADERRHLEASIAEHQRQRLWRRRTRHAVLSVAVSVSALMALLAMAALQAGATVQNQRDRAQRDAEVNRSLVLANAAMQVVEGSEDGPGYALPLALEAVNMEQPPAKAVAALRAIALSAGTRALLGEEGPAVRAVAFSPDARLGLSGSCAALVDNVCTQGALILWDLETRSEIRRFRGHTGWVNGVAFLPDGKTVLSASDDRTLIQWDVATGGIVHRFGGHNGAIRSLALSPDGRTIVTSAEDGTVRVWDLPSGQMRYQLPGTTQLASQVAFSLDGTLLASSADQAEIILWNVATGQELRRLRGHTGRITALAFKVADDGQTVLISSATDARFIEWDVDTGHVQSQKVTSTYRHYIAVDPSGRVVLSAFGPHAAVNDLYLDERFGVVEAGAVSPDGRLILLGQRGGLVRLCEMPVNAEVRRFEAETPVYYADVSEDGRFLLTGSLTGGEVILWDLRTGQEVRRFAFPYDLASGVLSPDGRRAALFSGDIWGTSGAFDMGLYEVETGREIYPLEGPQFAERSAAFSPDGRYLLLGTLQWGGPAKEAGAGDLTLWEVETGTLVYRFAETRAVMGVAFSPDGRRAVTTSGDAGDYISLWDIESGELIRRYERVPEIQFPQDVVWEPNSNRIIASGAGGFGELDLDTGRVTRVFRGLRCNVFSLDHSADWRYLVAGDNCTPSTIMVWDLTTAEEVEHLSAYANAPVWSVVFNPNELTFLASSMGDRPVVEWKVMDWPLDELLAWVRDNRYVRDFTCEERAQYRIEPLCR